MEHLPCSPDLATYDFNLCPKIKYALRGRRFQDTEDTQKIVDGTESYSTTGIPKSYQQWQHRRTKCIAAH
jgi:hypothetical protein